MQIPIKKDAEGVVNIDFLNELLGHLGQYQSRDVYLCRQKILTALMRD